MILIILIQKSLLIEFEGKSWKSQILWLLEEDFLLGLINMKNKY